jgi:3-phenylpropionate/trans-cinnamate dioxygenase alpha subunit
MPTSYFDADRGLLDPSVFSLESVYHDELERIFGRQWLFVGPLSWAAEPGQYVTATLGDIPVVLWQGPEGLGVFVNRCAGGEARLVEGDRGEAASISCPCHGWDYAPSPRPGMMTLDAAPRCEAYQGLIFACFDPDAPPLRESLGEFAFYLDLLNADFPGGLAVYGEAALHTAIPANWKLAAEAYCGDLYRDFTLTRATREALGDDPLGAGEGLQAATRAGGAVLASATDGAGWRVVCATLFPNLSYDGRGAALHIWRPLGPLSTEVLTYCLVGRDETEAQKEARRRLCQLRFGPAGLETNDQEAVWASATRASRGPLARRRPLNLQMGLGRTWRGNLPGAISDPVSEGAQRRFFAWWQDELNRPHLRTASRMRFA